MPYTFLHPSFILLFAKRFGKYVSIPALIIGSFIPDLDIIYRFSETRHHIFSYTLSNIIFTMIPIGIGLSYYIKLILLPIISTGKILPISMSLKQGLSLLPKIIFSLFIAILVHLYLDDFAHFDDAKGLSLRIGADLGYDPEETRTLYALLLYFPQLIISGIGLILTFICIYVFRKELKQHTTFLWKHKYSSLLISVFIFVTFTSMKIIKAGVERGMEIDSVLIGITTGLMSVFLLTPIGLLALTQIKTRSSVILPLVFILSIYMLGLGHKEYLSIFIIKGLFITFVSLIAFTIINYQQMDYKAYLILTFNFILVFTHPFSDYFTYLLFFASTLLTLYLIIKNKIPPYLRITLKSWIVGSLLSLAYYGSNKGLGPGILVLFLNAFSYEFSFYQKFPSTARILLLYLSMLLSCIVLMSAKVQLGAIGLLLILFMIIFNQLSQKLSLSRMTYLYFVITVPLLASLYLYFQFSRLYGIFSISQIFLMLLLAHSDHVKNIELRPHEN